MSVQDSASTLWRKQGNDLFSSATENFGPAIRIDRFKKAIAFYYKALNAAETDEEKASASKNMGIASWKLAVLTTSDRSDATTRKYYYKEALKHLSNAYDLGQRCKDQPWQADLASKLQDCLDCYKDKVSSLASSRLKEASSLEEMVEFLSVLDMRSDCWLEIGNLVFHEGITALQDGRYKDCLKCMHDCYRPVNEARRYSNIHSQSEVNVLEEDVLIQKCVAESIQARITGDELLDTTLKDMADLNMNLIFDVIDWYRQAILLTREKDMEQEAMAHARLGRLYGMVLKLKVPARENYNTAIQMAHSMQPRTFDDTVWYKESARMLKKYQDESVLGEQKKRDEEQKEVMKKLVPEMKQLGEHSGDSDKAFLKFVYSTFPPKNPAHKLGELDTTSDKKAIKKVLQKSVIHYHPDKANVEVDGLKWKVLCEEITKRLTRRYERMKDIS